MAVTVIGLDTAKHVFQIHGADAGGRAVLKKRHRRNQITDFTCRAVWLDLKLHDPKQHRHYGRGRERGISKFKKFEGPTQRQSPRLLRNVFSILAGSRTTRSEALPRSLFR